MRRSKRVSIEYSEAGVVDYVTNIHNKASRAKRREIPNMQREAME